MVPAGKARDVGFDRSLIGSYGHDDRVCAYGELTGILAADPEYTAVACFADKEETGSDGPTGMNSKMLSYFAMDLGRPYGIPGHVPGITHLSTDITHITHLLGDKRAG